MEGCRIRLVGNSALAFLKAIRFFLGICLRHLSPLLGSLGLG